MFPLWRLKIREARIAFQEGRWDEATRLLSRDSIREFLPAKRLSHEVASELVSRAQNRLENGDSLYGWSDLQQADELGGCDQQVAEVKAAQTERGFERIRKCLAQGDTTLAKQQLAKLEKRKLGGEQRRAWKLIVQHIDHAKVASDRGEMSTAVEALKKAEHLLPENNGDIAEMIASRVSQLRNDAQEVRRLSTELHQAISENTWTEVLSRADALLELAPEHTAARQARKKAWQAVGFQAPELTVDRKIGPSQQLKTTHLWKASADVDTMANSSKPGKRMLVWIDGVGAYLICFADEVSLGQPSGANGVDIPILADLSRRHATIQRQEGNYVLAPIHQASLDGKEITGPSVINDQNLIELGGSAKLRFRKPHALSATAVLELESHHKTNPAVDRILLMSESCVFGSGGHCHVKCRRWPEELVLFRRGEELFFRTTAQVELDGQECNEGLIASNSRLESDYFAMSFEEV